MMFGPTKGGNLCNVIHHNVIWGNQKTEYIVYSWLCGHADFDIKCIPAFLVSSHIISSVLLIR